MLALASAECKSVYPAHRRVRRAGPGMVAAYDDAPGTTGEPAEMFPMGRRRRYIVFFPGRAGGSFLASNLAEHPEVLITPEALVAYATSLDLPLLRIDYRDLMIDPPATLARVFEHIGVEPRPVAGSTLKNTSDDLRESVSNFDELRAPYVGTEYEAMFDEVLSV